MCIQHPVAKRMFIMGPMESYMVPLKPGKQKVPHLVLTKLFDSTCTTGPNFITTVALHTYIYGTCYMPGTILIQKMID